MVNKAGIAVCFMVATVFMICVSDSQAMPNFARKYNADCTMCHTQIPKLNRLGYEFRLAGYRLPSELGKDEKPFNLGDFFVARIQENWTYKKHNDVSPGKDTTSDQLQFFEFTMYPLTGSWGRNFGSITEFSMTPDDVFEVENAYVRGAFGDEKGWFQARLGIMHPWEGFGASDRPIGNTRPLFQKRTATGSPFFLWNLDESALEAGYHLAKSGTSIAARVSNGIMWKGDGSGAAEPAQGGALVKSEGGNTLGVNRKNYQVFLNQFITDTSAISLSYYYGVVPFVDVNEFAAPPENTLDTFSRAAAYANFWVVPQRSIWWRAMPWATTSSITARFPPRPARWALQRHSMPRTWARAAAPSARWISTRRRRSRSARGMIRST
ncbi:MAG TPA: hypothetical protein VIX18_11685, partial [Nitrospirota bacterium]